MKELKVSLRRRRRWVVAVLLTLLVGGCLVQRTPPGPNAVSGAVEGSGYLLLRWEAGLTVLIWDDIHGSHENSGGSSTSDPFFHQQGHAEAEDGRHYSYQLETRDGKTGRFSIDGQTYDLTQGVLFLITTTDGPTLVQQLQRDLTSIEPTNTGVEAFGRHDPAIAALIQKTMQ
ncbi:MAG: hypothetical protein R3C14_04685 [Caldilineaceae bacterium]